MAEWYERPIETYPARTGVRLVINGLQGGSNYPHRLYWPDHESQQRDLAALTQGETHDPA